MSFTKEIFERMDIKQICTFLLIGAEDYLETPKPYDERLKTESDPIYKRLHSIYSNEDDLDKAVADLSQALSIYEDVYMEIGMKAGARIIYQLLLKDDPYPLQEHFSVQKQSQ